MSWRPGHPESYSYLLGMYLGDGWAGRAARTARLTFTLDLRYAGIIDATAAAMQRSAPEHRVKIRAHRTDACVIVYCYAPHWLEAFPQAGPGRKHERVIVLAEWQRDIADAFPREFLRGLIHSDGCRTINRFKTKLPSGRVAEYEYPRYFFSNLSADIRGLFCEYCERLGIHWTQSNHRNISISQRRSVAILDAFIGPKT